MTRRQQLTYITGGFVIVSLIVLAMRWSVLADRVPLAMPPYEAIGAEQVTEPKANYSPPVKQGKAKPTKPKPGKATAKKPSTTKRVDINKASAANLEALPGIGPVLAERIVAYRKLHGRFSRLSDLDKVEGIGQMKLEGLEGLVTF